MKLDFSGIILIILSNRYEFLAADHLKVIRKVSIFLVAWTLKKTQTKVCSAYPGTNVSIEIF